jgi:hypothetical protein
MSATTISAILEPSSLVPKMNLSLAGVTATLSLVTYGFILFVSVNCDWFYLIHKPDETTTIKYSIGLTKYQQYTKEIHETKTDEIKKGIEGQGMMILLYCLLSTSLMSLSVAALFILHSSKPSKNVVYSLALIVLSGICSFTVVFLERIKVSSYMKMALLEYCKGKFSSEEDPSISFGLGLYILWVGAALSGVCMVLAVVRLHKYHLPHVSKIREELVKQVADRFEKIPDETKVAEEAKVSEETQPLLM